MKMDKDYTSITVCPATKAMLTSRDIRQGGGICPRCGHMFQDTTYTTFSHKETIPGRWKRPSTWEWLLGARREFITKESHDALIKSPKGNSNQPDDTQPGIRLGVI
jgi:hypothetical protein